MLALAAALTALLAVVALASRGGGASLTGGGGPSDTLWDYLLSTYLVVGTVAFFAIVFLLARERESLPTRRSKHRELRHLLQFAVVMVALFFVAPYLVRLLRSDDESGRATTTQTRPGDRKRQPGDTPEANEPQFRWAPVVALSALGAAGVAAVLITRRRRNVLTDAEVADALADVLDDALADLRAERDPRRAIIAAYARMERLLAVHGVPRHPAEAPFEYLGRVLVQLQASASSVFELTALFERAKFSRHTIDAGMRDEAVAALAAVRDELRGPPEELGPE